MSTGHRVDPTGRGRTVTRLLEPLPDACQQLGIGRSTFYELIAAGEIRTVKIGRRTLVARDELERYVRSLTEANADPQEAA